MNPEVINKQVWSRLTKIQEQNRVSGAYLFIGPRGLGKIDLAFDFICLDEKLEDKRDLIESGAHPDVVIVRPEIEEKKGKIREKQISIDQTKEALKMFSYFPGEASKKFLVIESIEKLTVTAANSLLKTVEELSGDYIVIMTVSGEGGTLNTIKSRCQRIYFNLKSKEDIEGFIKESQPDLESQAMSDIAFLSRGRVKEAQKLLANQEYCQKRMEKLNEFRQALRGDLKVGFKIAHDDTKDKQLFAEYLNDWAYYLNGFLKKNIFEDQDPKIQKKILKISKQLNEAQETLRVNQNANPRLLLENFFVQIK